MGPIKEDVMCALHKGYEKLVRDERAGFTSGVETERTIVFNSQIWDLLIEESKEHHRSFKEIRKDDPLLFHRLLGVYCGDLKMKNRIYQLTSEKDAYCLQAIALTPEISVRKFSKKKRTLCEALSKYGESEWYKSDFMDHMEKVLDRFHDDHPFSFKKTRFLYAAHLKGGSVVTHRLKDYVLVGNGYSVKKRAPTLQIPDEKKNYQGPFIHLVVRGGKKHMSKHFNILEEVLGILDN